jgi:hypothetical protein
MLVPAWTNIEQAINQKLQQEMEKQTQKQKIINLTTSKYQTTYNNINFQSITDYKNIHWTQEETKLLSKGMKYNLHHKQKDWIEILTLEAETAHK